MHVRSLRLLGRTHHDFEVIEAFLSHVATLGGVPLFHTLGYRGGAPVVVQLPGEHPFVGIAMEKRLSAVTLKAAA